MTLILVGLMMVAVLIVAALVIDYSLVRDNRQVGKSNTDFSAAAGIRSLDNGDGAIQPWKGVCAARNVLVANQPVFAGAAETFTDGNGTGFSDSLGVPFTGDLCAPSLADAVLVAVRGQICVANSPGTWAKYTAVSADGHLRATIRNGYAMPDAAFAEDADAQYAGDTGVSTNGGCDNLAVIVEESEDAVFGQVAGADEYTTRIRSVARLEVQYEPGLTAALVLLERTDCPALFVQGVGAKIIVEGQADDPGAIHADSDASGPNCNASDVQNGNVLQVNGNPGEPVIIARRSASGEPGVITAVSLLTSAGANKSHSPAPEEVCAQVDAADCQASSPVTGAAPTGRDVIGRGVVDSRYRTHLETYRDEAQTRFAWTSATLPAGWTEMACGAAVPAFQADGVTPADKIWVNCAGGAFDAAGKTFGSTVTDVVIDGYLTLSGSQSVRFSDVDTLYIKGQVAGPGILFEGSDKSIFINDGAHADDDGDGYVCDDRTDDSAADLAAGGEPRVRVVIGNGYIRAAGGSGKVLRLCSATVMMLDDTDDPDTDCPIPTSDGAAPYDSACIGILNVEGQNKLDWTAPNVNDVTKPTSAQLQHLEDLAFWTEASLAAVGSNNSGIQGTGGVSLAGIFFTPNAKPFRVGGNGAYDITDAQFLTRRLEVAGNGALFMSPQPQNAIQIPFLTGFTLVR